MGTYEVTTTEGVFEVTTEDEVAETPPGYQMSDLGNDFLAVGNRTVDGVAGLADLYETAKLNLSPYELGGARLFGLNDNKFNQLPEQSLGEKIKQGLESAYLYGPERARTEPGIFLSDVAENATAAAPFGPAAMIASGVLGGSGAYGGRKLGESVGHPEAGAAIGSIFAGITPGAIAKLQIVKALGKQLGPTISHVPGIEKIFGTGSATSAVGRALGAVSSDVSALEKNLSKINEIVGPKTRLDSLKTTAEIAGDRGLARAEDALTAQDPSSIFPGLRAERAEIRAGNVLSNYNPKETSYETSKLLEQAIAKSADEIKKLETAAWGGFSGKEQVISDIPELNSDLANVVNRLTYDGSLPLPGEAAAILKTVKGARNKGVATMAQIQDLRSRVLELGRDTRSVATAEDRVTNKLTKELEKYLSNIVDANAEAGVLPEAAVETWESARRATKFKIATFSAKEGGTKGTQALALEGKDLDNTALLMEGLKSPDKMSAHINAAVAGGEDVRPIYQQALKGELDGAAQWRWAEIIERKKEQWKLAFSADEMTSVEKNLDDIASELEKTRNSTIAGSATNPRGKAQEVLTLEKGLAPLLSKYNTAPLALAGATVGWNTGDTVPEKIKNAVIGGVGGVATGKIVGASARRASNKFDALLTEALRDPRAAMEALEAAKPSEFTAQLGKAVLSGARASAVRGAGAIAKDQLGIGPRDQGTAISEMFKQEESPKMAEAPEKLEKISTMKNEILDAVRTVESSDGKFLTSRAGARGAYQFMPATARAYSVDPTDNDETDDRAGAWELITDEYEALGSLPLALASYNAGRRRVNQAIKMAGSREWPDVQAALRELGLDETADYVTKYERLGIKV